MFSIKTEKMKGHGGERKYRTIVNSDGVKILDESSYIGDLKELVDKMNDNLDWVYHSVHDIEGKTYHLWQRVDRYGEIVYRLTHQPENGLDYVKPSGKACYTKEGLLKIGINVDNELRLHNL